MAEDWSVLPSRTVLRIGAIALAAGLSACSGGRGGLIASSSPQPSSSPSTTKPHGRPVYVQAVICAGTHPNFVTTAFGGCG